MKIRNINCLLSFLIIFSLNCCISQKLLLMMIDGFRWDYYENLKEKLPGITEFISEGVHTRWVEPIFPSETFPSMTTIATGVFPENHGILANFLMNRSCTDENEKYMDRLRREHPHEWLQAEPLWITTTKENKKTYIANWPFNAIPFHGILPEKLVDFNKSLSHDITAFEKELEISLELLSKDYSFVMQYYSEIDSKGHFNGPDSVQVQEEIIKFEAALQRFLLKVRNSNISNELNIIILSDHGMTNIGNNSGVTKINLGDYIKLEYVDKIVSKKIMLMIAATENCTEKLYDQLKVIPGVDAYKKGNIPNEYHVKNNEIMLDILVVARPGYHIQGFSGDKQIPSDDPCNCLQGDHGYSQFPDMRAVFFARGPAFKKGYLHTPIRLEDEYQVFAKVLGVSPLPNNGSWARVASLFS